MTIDGKYNTRYPFINRAQVYIAEQECDVMLKMIDGNRGILKTVSDKNACSRIKYKLLSTKLILRDIRNKKIEKRTEK